MTTILRRIYPVLQVISVRLIYSKPWSRIASYFPGTLLAFLWLDMVPSSALRQLTAQKETKIRIAAPFRIGLYLLASFLILSTTYGTYWNLNPVQGNWNLATNIAYSTLSRLAFVSGVGILIFLMLNGYASLPCYLLSHPFWTPLARLTYLAYLVHPMIIDTILSAGRVAYFWNPLHVIVYFLAFIMIAYSVALFIWLLIEKPVMNLEKIFLPNHVNSREQHKGK